MRLTFLMAPLLLVACKEQRPPAPTQEQSAQLNEAENMLNAEEANEQGSKPNTSEPAARTP